jgi:glycosyltransferase involved in cell wall biosynthesis
MPLLFSVIIPSYNRAHTLPQAIKSVLNQTYPNWELLVVDDGSSDNTQSIIESYTDQRIVYIKKENGGVCSARNLGAYSANGDYLIFLDSDDDVTEKWLENFWSASHKILNPDIICGGIQLKDSISKKISFIDPLLPGKGSNGWAVVIPGAFAVKKEFFMQCGLYDGVVKYAENTELFIRFELQNPVISYTYGFDLLYLPSLDGGSKNQKNILESTRLILKKHKSWFDKYPENKFVYVNVIAVNASLLKKNNVAYHYFFLALKMKPFFIKTYYRIFKLIFKLY